MGFPQDAGVDPVAEDVEPPITVTIRDPAPRHLLYAVGDADGGGQRYGDFGADGHERGEHRGGVLSVFPLQTGWKGEISGGGGHGGSLGFGGGPAATVSAMEEDNLLVDRDDEKVTDRDIA